VVEISAPGSGVASGVAGAGAKLPSELYTIVSPY